MAADLPLGEHPTYSLFNLPRALPTQTDLMTTHPEGKAGKNPDVLQQRNEYRNCGTFTQWSTTQLLKTMTS